MWNGLKLSCLQRFFHSLFKKEFLEIYWAADYKMLQQIQVKIDIILSAR